MNRSRYLKVTGTNSTDEIELIETAIPVPIPVRPTGVFVAQALFAFDHLVQVGLLETAITVRVALVNVRHSRKHFNRTYADELSN